MEYKPEFETRKDVFRVNVFHNKKTGEQVTMYFVPQTTPVNEDTLFNYCTKNKTWREKQAQQWCDEKNGKNKDKLKSLPFVAGGLQRDLKWFGDKATALFDDYKKGLGMAVQPRSNNKQQSSTGGKALTLADKVKAVNWQEENMVIANFRKLFGISDEKDLKAKMPTKEIGHYPDGTSKIEATYKYNDREYREVAHSAKDARRQVILSFLEQEFGDTTKADAVRAENREAEARQQELLGEMKYLKVLSERPDVELRSTSRIDFQRPAKGRIPVNSFVIDTPYGKHELETSEVSLTMVKAVKLSAEERKLYHRKAEEAKKQLVERLKKDEAEKRYWAEYDRKLKEEEEAQRRKAEAVQRTRELVEKGKRAEIENADISLVEKTENGAEHRAYILQDDKGDRYKLTVDYGDKKVIDREHHLAPYEKGYGFLTNEVEHQHIEKPMKTLTVAYEKVGGKENEKFALSAAVEPEAYAQNPLSIDLVFGANLKLTTNQKEDKDQVLMLRKLLKESKDPINASPKKFKEQQSIKQR